MSYSLVQESSLEFSAEKVWDRVRRMSVVNLELSPYATMSYPGDDYLFAESDTVLDEFLFRSWILLFGFIPMDWHFVRMRKVVDNRGFSEDSVSITHKFWRHDRWIEPTSDGCVLRDEVVFQPRMPLIGHLVLPVYRLIFRNRHRRLAELLGRE